MSDFDNRSGFPLDEYSSGPAYSPGKRQGGCRGCFLFTCGCLAAPAIVLVVLVVVLGAFGISIFRRMENWVRNDPGYQEAVQRVTTHPKIREKLGDSVREGPILGVRYYWNADGRRTHIQFQITGDKGPAVVYVVVHHQGDRRKIEQLVVQYADGTIQNLLLEKAER